MREGELGAEEQSSSDAVGLPRLTLAFAVFLKIYAICSRAVCGRIESSDVFRTFIRCFIYCPFDQKKIIIFSNLTDLAVTCCVLHSHGE
jgi:hypothetical protein